MELKKSIINLLYRVFKSKQYRLRNKKDYRIFLKSKSKNELIKIILDLQLKLSKKNLKLKRKAARDLKKSQDARKKLLEKEIKKAKK